MIIFDLDNTLADCEHRLHFVDPVKDKNAFEFEPGRFYYDDARTENHTMIAWKPHRKSFYEACSEDKPILPMKNVFLELHEGSPFDWNIWSGRCESVRSKTLQWLDDEIFSNNESIAYIDRRLKMRPIGDYTPDDKLKERWLDEALANGQKIEFAFDDSPNVVAMYRRRGIFVFDCNQTGWEK